MCGMPNRILVITAVTVEKEAVTRGLLQGTSEPKMGSPQIEVFAAGVGPLAAAVTTAKILADNSNYDLVVSTGIGGGFATRAQVGSLAVADRIIGADLGVETLEGFRSLSEMGLGFNEVMVKPELLDWLNNALLRAGRAAAVGPIITVSTATGTAQTLIEMERRVPGVVAEGMEGYGVAVAADRFGIPAVEIRAISNLVGPRDRASWKIAEALSVLEQTFAAIAQSSK